MSYLCYIGFGSNLGDSRQTLVDARAALQEVEGIEVEQCSSLYRTAPVGDVPQPDYLNMVARLRTSLSPEDLLAAMQRVEQQFGRVRTVVWGPRTLDLDLLFYGDVVMSTPFLTLPHPQIPNRGFVLEPMVELDPDFVHPVSLSTMNELYERWVATVGSPDRYVSLVGSQQGNP